MNVIEKKVDTLREIILHLKKVIVAFSGGIDSTFLADMVFRFLKENAVAVTLASPLFAADELEETSCIASEIGIKHYIIDVNNQGFSWFKDNPPNRCYICKKGLLELIESFAKANNIEGQIIEGSNIDDLNDYRPGFQALKEKGVRSPLLEASLTKEEIRLLSRKNNITNWNKPSSPCLATRFPFGESITSEKLLKVFQAERYLKSFGLKDVRVRIHGEIARIEVEQKQIPVILKNTDSIIKQLKLLGFSFITVDLDGYKKGSMNRRI